MLPPVAREELAVPNDDTNGIVESNAGGVLARRRCVLEDDVADVVVRSTDDLPQAAASIARAGAAR
jgi:hypothetical protein